MIWLVIAVVVVVLAVLMLAYDNAPANPTDYQARVELHAVRRRFEVAQVKHETRGDTADARRRLRDELDGLGRRS